MAKFSLDSSYLEVVAKMLKEYDLREVSLSDEKSRITIKRGEKKVYTALPAQSGALGGAGGAMFAPAASTASAQAPHSKEDESAQDGGTVVSAPVVGTVYLALRPTAPPFVKVGVKVKEGQTLLIIEAMKIMNQIPAPCSGVVRKIHAANAQPVEFGDALVTIDEG